MPGGRSRRLTSPKIAGAAQQQVDFVTGWSRFEASQLNPLLPRACIPRANKLKVAAAVHEYLAPQPKLHPGLAVGAVPPRPRGVGVPVSPSIGTERDDSISTPLGSQAVPRKEERIYALARR